MTLLENKTEKAFSPKLPKNIYFHFKSSKASHAWQAKTQSLQARTHVMIYV